VLLVAIAAGKATHAWEKALLLILNFVFEAGVLLCLFGEVWFLAKTIMAAGMGAPANSYQSESIVRAGVEVSERDGRVIVRFCLPAP